MSNLKIYESLFLIKLRKRVFADNKRIDTFLVICVAIVVLLFGVYNGLMLKYLCTQTGKNISAKVLYIIAVFLYSFHGIFPGLKKIGTALLINIYPLKNIEKITLTFLNEVLTIKFLFFSAFIIPIAVFSLNGYEFLIFVQFIISILTINFCIRVILSIQHNDLIKLSYLVCLTMIFLDFFLLHGDLDIIKYTTFIFAIFLFFFLTLRKINFRKTFHKQNIQAKKSSKSRVSFPFLKNSSVRSIFTFTIVSKIILASLISIIFYKFIFGYSFFLTLILSPLLWFNYLFNNFIGINQTLYVNIHISGMSKKNLFREYILLISKICLLDFMLSVFLFLIFSNLPFGKFEITKYSTGWLILVYWQTILLLIPFAFISSFYFFINISENFFSKNSTSSWASLISILLVTCISTELYFESIIYKISCFIFSFILSFFLFAKAGKIYTRNRVSILEKFKN